MRHRFIAVEGNIGAGKTTLATLLAKHYSARLILEEFANNDFLPKFYKDPERYAFPLELSFFADRYKQLKQTLLHPDLFGEKVVTDYVLVKSKLFAKTNLAPDEYDLFQRLFDMADLHVPPPDLLIYLQSPIWKLQQNIHHRGRDYEQEISDRYLESVEEMYQQYLKQLQRPTIVVDMASVDFLKNPSHLQQLVAFVEEDSAAPRRLFTLS